MSGVHRLACLTAGATLSLIVAGGLVTNTGAALAVPDWPTTFGHGMFAYPWSRLDGGILIEHGHRLLGSLVGILTVGLAGALWVGDTRGWPRLLGAVAVLLVCVQGLLGGLRVLWLRDGLAILHGCLAQAFFALVVALAWCTAPPVIPSAALPAPAARGLRRGAMVAGAAVYGQVILGALTTHGRHPGWIAAHAAGALIVLVLTGVLAVGLLRHRRSFPRLGPALAGLLVLQLGSGLGAYAARLSGLPVPGGEAAVIGFPVAHRAVGALLLGTIVVVALVAGAAATAGARPARERLQETLSSEVAA